MLSLGAEQDERSDSPIPAAGPDSPLTAALQCKDCAPEGSGFPNLEFPAVQYPELICVLITEEEVLRKKKIKRRRK